MATLVLSTVGTVLGGPVGGAIGALIGQSIDQEVLAPSKRGPRLGDLSVQTSSYGTQIPRIYGTMRVAGSIVWATDLAESSATAGAKGQPDTTYSYSVSFAVALAARPLTAIKRVWADGKLIRDSDGVFKIATGFRFYPGGEDQVVDPLIGSIEGIANTPAYRGLALAVFENLELAEFGNRIPFLTFEVIADDAAPALGTILRDLSQGSIDCEHPQTVDGYAAYGRSIASAARPLVEAFAIDLFDDGDVLRAAASATPMAIDEDELGTGPAQTGGARFARDQAAALDLPASLRLSYYDPARDFQTGEARATAGENGGSEETVELAGVIDAGAAKSLAQQIVARRWAGRDTVTVRLPPHYLALEPGSLLDLPLTPARWKVGRCTIERFAVAVELKPAWAPSIALAGASGSIVQGSAIAVGPLALALFEVPDLAEPSNEPTLLLAASSPTRGWKSQPIALIAGTGTTVVQTATRKTLLGVSQSVLEAGEPFLFDAGAFVDIALIDGDQWLTSCDDAALAGGQNLAVLGSELLQFGNAELLGAGRFRLSRLVRGRGGTEWATGTHTVGEAFALVERDALRSLPVPDWLVGSALTARTLETVGSTTPASCERTISGDSRRPPSPVGLTATLSATGDLAIDWTRRSRRGWAWLDEVDTPLGEARESYRVTVEGQSGAIEQPSDAPSLTVSAADLAALGVGPLAIAVRQIGDTAASRAARLNISID